MKKILLLLTIFLCFENTHGQCWDKVATGTAHSLAIKSNGTLWAWGENSNLQLGTGNTINVNVPTQIGLASDWVAVAAGSFFSLALKQNGTLWAWGDNNSGQLGLGNFTSVNIPTQVGNASDWKVISAGNDFSNAVKINGTLWAWGENTNGYLGTNDNYLDKNVPTQIGTATDWTTVSAGYRHSLGRKGIGELWVWGYDGGNQTYGIGQYAATYSDVRYPFRIGTNYWDAISAGNDHNLAINANGTLWAWGRNYSGQIGNGQCENTCGGTHVNVPTQIGTANDWIEISATGDLSRGIRRIGFLNQTLWAWGRNDFGALGNGNNIDVLVPTQIGTGTLWTTLSHGGAYFFHTLQVNFFGNLFSTGRNNEGQLGDGTNINKNILTQIGCGNVVPISLINFTGKNKNTTNLLNWATANETNSKNFEIQHSTDGINFSSIGSVKSVGNSSIITNYNFTDNNPFYGFNYYRLKQNDIDGKFEYSAIVSVKNIKPDAVVISPNPASNELYVDGAKNNTQYFITDMAGRLVLSGVYENNKAIPINKLLSAVYFLKIDNEVYKFIKQ
jgi:alpha-tubulin suppressor-like RCC1 family protein